MTPSRLASADSCRAPVMPRENLARVLMSATNSSRPVVEAMRSGGRSSHLSAVPRPRSWSLPCRRHFWHCTQSTMDEILWKTPLNWRLRDHQVCTWGLWKSLPSSKAVNTSEHDWRMHESRRRSTSSFARSPSSSAPKGKARAKCAPLCSARRSTTKAKCRSRTRWDLGPARCLAKSRAGEPCRDSPWLAWLRAIWMLVDACMPDNSR
mmetsp:Transcript_2653/g.8723  ORF Transcript_2653/g.8723 Transcript_2653/m.8723 type:complete len:208 (+) Transcript_2653:641-1264(+)